jgi:hypothetical protein
MIDSPKYDGTYVVEFRTAERRVAGAIYPKNHPTFSRTYALWIVRAGYGCMLNDILADIVKLIVAGGGLVAIAFALFKFVGEKWLDKWLTAKFDKEIEHLRLKNNVLMNRTAKLHQWEFEVLPEAWSRLNDAFTTISGLGLRFDQNLDGIPGGTAKRVSE